MVDSVKPPSSRRALVALLGGASAAAIASREAKASYLYADHVPYLPPFTGSTLRTAGAKLAERVSVLDFGADNTGATSAVAAIQAAANYAMANGRKLCLPAGTYLIDVGSINITNSLVIEGESWQPSSATNFSLTFNGPCFNVTAVNSVQFKNFTITGNNNAGSTSQAGVLLTGTNLVEFDHVAFTRCYNSVSCSGTVFFLNFHRVRWFDCINAHVIATAAAVGPGFQLVVDNCEMIPGAGIYGFLFTNAGSVQFNCFGLSPAGLTNGIRYISLASQAGEQRFTNCVFETNQAAISIEGASGTPLTNFFFTGCNFNQNTSTVGSVNIFFGDRIHFTDCYHGGVGWGVNVVTNGSLRHCTIKGGSAFSSLAAVHAQTGATIDGLDLVSLDASACGGPLLDLSAATTAINVTVSSPNPGPNASPVLMPSGQSANCRVLGNLGGKNQYNAAGNFQVALNGSQSLVSIPHGLITTPSFWSTTNGSFLGTTTNFIRETVATSTTLSVQLDGSPPAGTYTFAWEARV